MNSIDYVVNKVLDAIRKDAKKKTTGYDAIGTVRRIEGNIAWVHFDNGLDETPVNKSIDCKKGDKVRVRISNGSAFLVGNDSAPPTDDTNAIAAKVLAKIADNSATVAHEVADAADGKATDAKETAEAILVYDHAYTPDTENPNIMHFTAYLYQGGVDVKTKFDEEQFTWYLKTEDGEVYKGYGYTKDFDIEECGYGAEVIGKFTTTDDSELLTSNDDTLTDNNDTPYSVRATGDHVRISDLMVSTMLYPTDKLVISGAEDEHLVTINSLQGYLEQNMSKQVLCDTTSGWNAQSQLTAEAGVIYVYTDYKTSTEGNIAGFKIGDGSSYLIDLPFTDALLEAHIADDTRHITSAEREFWNNKVRCYLAGVDQLIFTTA